METANRQISCFGRTMKCLFCFVLFYQPKHAEYKLCLDYYRLLIGGSQASQYHSSITILSLNLYSQDCQECKAEMLL